MNNHTDFRQRFVFDELDARGCIVQLRETCESIQNTHHYPANLAKLINQFALAAVLLRDSIKIDGSLTIQLRTPGAIKLLMADCMADRRIRAISEYESSELAPNDSIALDQLGEGSMLAITISPDGGERYQSIVPIEHASLAECLEDYFQRSEQLPSVFSLFADSEQATGIALHALPTQKVTNPAFAEQEFARLALLLRTLSEQEALELDSAELLTRLFHEESCRLFDEHAVEFGCACSAEKSFDAVLSLGEDEVNELIQEQRDLGNTEVEVDCHFCFQRYYFDFERLENSLKGASKLS